MRFILKRKIIWGYMLSKYTCINDDKKSMSKTWSYAFIPWNGILTGQNTVRYLLSNDWRKTIYEVLMQIHINKIKLRFWRFHHMRNIISVNSKVLFWWLEMKINIIIWAENQSIFWYDFKNSSIFVDFSFQYIMIWTKPSSARAKLVNLIY